jgi:hypothetical protein
MGHQLFGDLPAHRLLPEIVRYLVEGGTPTDDLVDEVTDFSQKALDLASNDPVFTHALWLLIRVPQAAGSCEFLSVLQELGMRVGANPSMSDLLVSYDAALQAIQRRTDADLTDLSEISRLAGVAALGDALQRRLPGLWDPSDEDVRASLSALRSPERFADTAHRFFSNFVERVIHYFVDRNLHQIIGTDRMARSNNDLEIFNRAIRRHCDEAAVIMRIFAREWLGKNHFRDQRQITPQLVRRFSAYTAQKLRQELNQRKGAK